MENLSRILRERTRQAWGEFDADPDRLRTRWQDFVLGELLRYPPAALRETAVSDVDIRGPFKPDQVVLGAAGSGGHAVRLHVYRREVDPELAARVCRDTRTPLALSTDGRFWTLVHARPGGPTSTAVFDADLWSEEPIMLRAFASLLSPQRVLAPSDRPDTLTALFARTEDEQTRITGTLGEQVRQAVELLVGELSRLDREAGGTVLAQVDERSIYRGALRTLMRLVFLLYAEQRELLPVKDPVYRDGYAVTTLHRQLSEDRDRHGEEVGDRRSAAWLRLQATFRAIHGGSEHPDLRIAAHGGSLFDPAVSPWLAAVPVTDRVVHEILESLLVLKHRGKAAERLSYQALDVEQIGHVYEGLLDFSCRKVDEPYLGLIGKREPELPLARVEAGVDFKEVCGLTSRQVEKALAAQPTPNDLAALHAACDNDSELAERVRPFWGLLRKDLRGAPTVFPAKSVVFTNDSGRRATGTYYTPRALAREIVEHTLAPLCRVREASGVSRPRTAEELLSLKVCDPTMGSGGFLVSACEYLADRLVEAWERDGYPSGIGGTAEDIRLAAMRMIAARCLYGVDRDELAVDLAKLSLWLLTLAKGRPFSFVDHALRCGDSLIGLISERQVESFHLDPDRAGLDSGRWTFGIAEELISPVLAEVADLRRCIEDRAADDIRQINEKQDKLNRADRLTRRLRFIADVVVGAALSTFGQGEQRYRDRLAAVSEEAIGLLAEEEENGPVERKVRRVVAEWLTGGRSRPLRPFHWALEFPEVLRRGGFDAIVGNPPFVGGQRLTGSIGHDVREYLVTRLAKGKRGSADLCSYFLLRNLEISAGGRVGIIATNTIAQGDTREVGLDQATRHGWRIYRAIKSQPWPGTASLEVSLLWVGHTEEGEVFHLDGRQVSDITPSLDPPSRASGNPHRLASNAGQSFQGTNILGTGFLIEPAHAAELIARSNRNRDVLFPYLNGEDLNSRPDCSAARWTINFHDWNEARAAEYTECFAIVEHKVKPERIRNKYSKTARERWWQYERIRPELYKAVGELKRVLTIALVSRTGLPLWVPTGQVFSHMLGVFATDRDAHLSLLSSNLHFAWWTIKGASTMRTDARYTPSDGFETFPQPELTARMDRAGEELHRFRRGVMLDRQLGLTKLYNLVHDESVNDPEVRRLREIHTEVDDATAEAYGWSDLGLGHGFHDTRQGRRFTIDPVAQVEVLDRLLELNHQRYAEEVALGPHRGSGSKRGTAPAPPTDGGLF
ncbi:Eco57I restriction-modification methylase domain-containing protein [Saccharothrix deserti]|uniref:Eco57I restriction-modification methylase domain-containing protein n=1 Tax=Saccharothrix deserti TaxID=2593674 RepID=UPI00131C0C86|nr:N-6 DNA methylase [Saccharothrix deserti]